MQELHFVYPVRRLLPDRGARPPRFFNPSTLFFTLCYLAHILFVLHFDEVRSRHQIVSRASVKIYSRAILSTPGTSGFRLSYKRVLRVVPHKPLRSGIF